MNLILTADAAPAGGGYSMILMMVLMFAVFYFFFIRPENKKKKTVEEMRSNLSVGDEITTIGAMTGKIVQVTEDTVTFETGEDRVRIQIKKWGVSTTAKMEAAEAEARAAKTRGRKK
jgi:preprotein translocase subunit YajC